MSPSVILVGASGNAGKPIFEALLSAPVSMTVLTRKSSTSHYPYPESIKLVAVEYSDFNALVDAMKGHDVLILTLPFVDIIGNTMLMTDAAIEAGVKRIIPSEFGNDTLHNSGIGNPFFDTKATASNYIKKQAREGKITYTNIITGQFLDWGLETGFIGFDLKNRVATLYNDGKSPFRATTTWSTGRVVVNIICSDNFEKTSNKTIRISDSFVSQRDILEVLEEVMGKWTRIFEDVSKLFDKSKTDLLSKGNAGDETIKGLVNSSGFAMEGSASWPDEESDNELVGLTDRPFYWRDVVQRIARTYHCHPNL